MARRRKPRLTRPRVIALSAATAVLLAFGTGAVLANTGSTDQYRTATAQLGSVDETLSVNGSIASAVQRDLAFGVGGTVDAIAVEVGQTVSAGDELASLATDDLQEAVDAANSELAQAEQTLASDLESQTSTSTSSSSSSSSSTGSAPTSNGGTESSGPSAAETEAIANVTAAQQTLLELVDAATASLAASQAAGASAITVCQPFLDASLAEDPAEDPAPEDGTEPEPDPTATDPADSSAELTAIQDLLVACQSAITGTSDAQAVTEAGQVAVAGAMTALDDAIAELQAALGAPSSSSPGGSTGGGSTDTSGGSTDTSGGSTTTPSSGSATTGGSTASAAAIVADRAAIESAQAQVDIAEQQLAAAVLTTPIAGTVAQIAFSEGEKVSANSSTAVVTVLGDDGYIIESTVSLAQVAKVSVDQSAVVTITSSGATYDATVSAVGISNVSETSTPSYSVTIFVDAAGDVLLSGAAATVDIAVSSGDSVLTIPISALHSETSGDTVDLLADGEVTATPVEVGAIGADAVEITSGLSEGDVVVIADLDEAIATETTTETGLTGLTDTDTDVEGGFTGTPPTGFTSRDG